MKQDLIGLSERSRVALQKHLKQGSLASLQGAEALSCSLLGLIFERL